MDPPEFSREVWPHPLRDIDSRRKSGDIRYDIPEGDERFLPRRTYAFNPED
ncbi:MAG: hypothetical protein AAF497_24185 [Planctomycetota bacterium]